MTRNNTRINSGPKNRPARLSFSSVVSGTGPVLIVEGADRHGVMAVLNEAVEQIRPANLTEPAFGPVGRAVTAYVFFALELDRIAALDGHHRTAGPTPTHRAVADVDGAGLGQQVDPHAAAETTRRI